MTSKQLSVHLISDQGVDSLTAVFKESTCRFKSVDFQENIWPFTNTEEKLKSVKLNIRKRKSFVLYTIKENGKFPIQIAIEQANPRFAQILVNSLTESGLSSSFKMSSSWVT